MEHEILNENQFCGNCHKLIDQSAKFFKLTEKKSRISPYTSSIQTKKKWCLDCGTRWMKRIVKQEIKKDKKMSRKGFKIIRTLRTYAENGMESICLEVEYKKMWYTPFLALPTLIIMGLLVVGGAIALQILFPEFSCIIFLIPAIYSLVISFLLIFNRDEYHEINNKCPRQEK